MKNHRMPVKRAECLADFARFAQRYRPDSYTSFKQLWDDTQESVKYFGRYMGIKYIEMLRKFGDAGDAAIVPDLRLRGGGWSPRMGLTMLWPQNPKHVELLLDRSDESDSTIELAESYARKTQARLAKDGVTVSMFQLQVLLCEYQEIRRGRYYPGESHDCELGFAVQARAVFGREPLVPFMQARSIFPQRFLGEWSGWDGPREHMYKSWIGGIPCQTLL